MTEFVVRARAAAADADRFLSQVGQGLGVEYLADIVRHSLFVSQGHREEVTVSLVLEKSQDFSRVVSISGASLGSLDDIHEAALLKAIADALRAGNGLKKHETRTDDRGISVTAKSFEQLVRERAEAGTVFLLDPDGLDVRKEEVLTELAEAVFVMTDHTPMPKNTYKSMQRQGVKKLSLGPGMLHTAQCVSILLNELDRLRNNPPLLND